MTDAGVGVRARLGGPPAALCEHAFARPGRCGRGGHPRIGTGGDGDFGIPRHLATAASRDQPTGPRPVASAWTRGSRRRGTGNCPTRGTRSPRSGIASRGPGRTFSTSRPQTGCRRCWARPDCWAGGSCRVGCIRKPCSSVARLHTPGDSDGAARVQARLSWVAAAAAPWSILHHLDPLVCDHARPGRLRLMPDPVETPAASGPAARADVLRRLGVPPDGATSGRPAFWTAARA